MVLFVANALKGGKASPLNDQKFTCECRGRNKTRQRRNKTRQRRRSKTGFLQILLEVTGVELISSENQASSSGYGSAGGQPERWTLPKGLIPRCCGTAYPGPRHSSQKAHWSNAENSGGLGAAPPWLKIGEGTRMRRDCPPCKETTHSSPAARFHPQSSQGFQLRRTRRSLCRRPLGRESSASLSAPHGFPQGQVKLSARSQRRRPA